MTFYKGGAKKRRDAIEADVIETFRAYGAEVWQISGRGLPDLLVRYKRRVKAFEVKSGPKKKRTPAQEESGWPIISGWEGVHLVIKDWRFL